jgi:hypothetical protein
MKFIGYLEKNGFTIGINSESDGSYVLEWTNNGFVKKEQRTIPSKEKLLEVLNKRFGSNELLDILPKL